MSRAATALLCLLAAAPAAFAAPEGVWRCTGFPKTGPPFEVRFEFTAQGEVLRLPSDSGPRKAAPLQMLRSQERSLVQWTDLDTGVVYRGRLSAQGMAGALASRAGGDVEGDFECEPDPHSSVAEQDAGDFDEKRFLSPDTKEQVIEPAPKPASKPKPAPKALVAPAYPIEAMDEDIEGRVVVCFYVDRQGRVHEPLVMDSSDEIFEAPVLKALSRSTYRPAVDDEQPARSHLCRTYKFWLD